ncbi:hypothetical protein EDC04DRAFT_2755261, partial [Pisolithus marmoratus]
MFFTLGGHLTLFSRFDQLMTSTGGSRLLLPFLLSSWNRAAFCKVRTLNTCNYWHTPPLARTDPIPPCWTSAF